MTETERLLRQAAVLAEAWMVTTYQGDEDAEHEAAAAVARFIYDIAEMEGMLK
jgi:hypothetical protein